MASMDKNDVVLKSCETKEEFDKSIALRNQVFCHEQSFSEELEVDEHDKPFPKSTVIHIIAVRPEDQTVIGTARMLRKDDYALLGRLAVSKEARRQHLGERLVTQGESTAAGLWGAKSVLISSQYQVQGFYERCGYKRTDEEEHLDEGWRRIAKLMFPSEED